jgi:molybdopterin-containing oxidoreductase family membrane subunit
LLVIVGGLIQMYVIIIGGQAYPLDIFPGKEVIESGFFDGQVVPYAPSLWEVLLGLGGVAVALIMVSLAVKVLRFLPASLADEDVDPHHAA